MDPPTRPHARARKNYLLLAAVPIFFLAFIRPVVAQYRCIFDRIANMTDPPSTAMVLELPRQGRSDVHLAIASEAKWAPIRFRLFAEDLKNKLKHCTAVGDIRSTFDGGITICTKNSILTVAKKKIILNEILPRATKMHAERLLVKPITGRLVVPNYTRNICSYFTVPRSHHTEGVEDADMVLYVSAVLVEYGVFGWAATCSVQDKTWRPTVGAINLSPSSAIMSENAVRIAAHEVAHALGFNIKTMQMQLMVLQLATVRGKPGVRLVASSKTLEKTRAHYNCSTAPGMELEDEGGVGTAESHWERRNAKDELMSGIGGIGYYTALTMAAFEDMGFYRVNWSMAETMNWGRNSGCDLLEKKCLIDGISVYPDMFCNSSSDLMFCTSDRRALGSCFTYFYSNLSSQYWYFKDFRYSGDSDALTDYCPLIEPYSNTGCTNGQLYVIPGSRIGPTSKCLKGEKLYYGWSRVGDVCAEVQCNRNGTLHVRYLGNDTWHACPEGSRIKPKGNFRGGAIVCPKYSEVCFETASERSDANAGAEETAVRNAENTTNGPVNSNLDVVKEPVIAEGFMVSAENITVLPGAKGFQEPGEDELEKTEPTTVESTNGTDDADKKESVFLNEAPFDPSTFESITNKAAGGLPLTTRRLATL